MYSVGKTQPGFPAGFNNLNPNALDYLGTICGLLTYAIGIDTGVMYDLTSNEYNWTNDGTTLTIAAIYPELVIADTNLIIYDAIGDPKPLVIATLASNTLDQFFFDSVKDRVMFFKTPLTGYCLEKVSATFA